jgi:hypothetical protein
LRPLKRKPRFRHQPEAHHPKSSAIHKLPADYPILVQLCFDFYMIEAKPENLIGDRAYDSDPLDEELRNNGIEMIAPHRSNRTKAPTQEFVEQMTKAILEAGSEGAKNVSRFGGVNAYALARARGAQRGPTGSAISMIWR